MNNTAHRERIDQIALEIINDIKSGDLDPADLTDKLHEECDNAVGRGSDAADIMANTDNEDAFERHMGMSHLDTKGGWDRIVEQFAYFALYDDVIDEIDRRGFDVNAQSREKWFPFLDYSFSVGDEVVWKDGGKGTISELLDAESEENETPTYRVGEQVFRESELEAAEED